MTAMSGAGIRKGVLSALFVAWIAGVLSFVLVGAPGVNAIQQRTAPLVTAAAVDQDWRMFAPAPPRTSQRLEAVTLWSDGRSTVWRIPTHEPLLGTYSDYRWRKWSENTASDAIGSGFWRPAARYVIAHLPARPGATPRLLRLVRFSRDLPAPGEGGMGPWRSVELYRAQLAS
jgi:hypothetical protein